MSTVAITPVVGLPRQHGWAQAFHNSSRSFICVFAISGDSAGNVGRDLVDKLREETPQTPEELHQFLSSSQEEVSAKNCDLQLAASLFTNDQVWFGVYDGLVILRRGSKVGQIVSPQKEILVIKGKATPSDVFVLGTRQIQSVLGEVVQKLEQGYEADTIVTSIVPGVHGQEDSSQSALVFITMTPEEETVESRLVVEDMLVDDLEPEPSRVTAATEDLQPELPPELKPELEIADNQIKMTPQPTWFKKDQLKVILGRSIAITKQLSKKLFDLVKPFFSSDIYVRQPKQKKFVRMLVLLVIVGFLIGAPLFWWRYTVSAQRSEAQNQVEPLLQQVESAKAKVDDDPITARQEVESVIADLKVLEQTFENKRFSLKIIQEATQEIQAYYEDISGKEAFSQLPVFFDLRTIESGFITNASDLVDETAYFLDRGKMQLIALNINSKQQQLFDISQVGTPKNIAASDDAVFIVSDKGIFRFDRDSTPDEVRIIQTRSEEDQNKTATLIDTFGEFVYVFNPDQRNIYRYTPAEEGGGLGDPTGWIRSGQNIEFDQITSLQIDGDIWLTDKNGAIVKMTSGREADFTPEGVTDGLSTSLILFTKEDYENIYLLEADKNRLLVLTKEGQFLKEITSGSLASGTSLFVDEANNKAYVVSGAEVFEVAL